MFQIFWRNKKLTRFFSFLFFSPQPSTQQPPTLGQALKEAFKIFDKNKNGYIEAKELRSVTTTLGQRLTDEEFQEFWNEADQNGDGKLDYNEFIKIMLQYWTFHSLCDQRISPNFCISLRTIPVINSTKLIILTSFFRASLKIFPDQSDWPPVDVNIRLEPVFSLLSKKLKTNKLIKLFLLVSTSEPFPSVQNCEKNISLRPPQKLSLPLKNKILNCLFKSST